MFSIKKQKLKFRQNDIGFAKMTYENDKLSHNKYDCSHRKLFFRHLKNSGVILAVDFIGNAIWFSYKKRVVIHKKSNYNHAMPVSCDVNF